MKDLFYLSGGTINNDSATVTGRHLSENENEIEITVSISSIILGKFKAKVNPDVFIFKPLTDYDAILKEQNGECYLCHKPLENYCFTERDGKTRAIDIRCAAIPFD